MSDNLTFRQLTSDDAPALRTVRLRALTLYPHNYTGTYAYESAQPLNWFKARVNGDMVYGAFDGDALIATAALSQDKRERNGHKAHLYMVYVAPEYQGRNIARQLVTILCDAAIGTYEHILLSVEAGNVAAIRSYTNLGFVQYGYEPHAAKTEDGIYLDDVLMIRFLTSTLPADKIDGN